MSWVGPGCLRLALADIGDDLGHAIETGKDIGPGTGIEVKSSRGGVGVDLIQLICQWSGVSDGVAVEKDCSWTGVYLLL